MLKGVPVGCTPHTEVTYLDKDGIERFRHFMGSSEEEESQTDRAIKREIRKSFKKMLKEEAPFLHRHADYFPLNLWDKIGE